MMARARLCVPPGQVASFVQIAVLLLAIALWPSIGTAAPREGQPRLDPRQLSALPSYFQRVEPAIVGLSVEVPRDRPSALTLGAERWGSGVIFDAAGHVLTVSYVVLDAQRIEATLRDGRKVPARLVGLDLEVGVGVVKLEGAGPWPTATLGDSTKVAVGDIVGTVGVSDDGRLAATPGRVDAVRPFSAAWEYMLDRAFVVSPYNAAFGGATLVDSAGAVIGVTSLRLGEAPYVNLVIPVEKFLPGKDELLAKGRVASRRPRPWLGLYTVSMDGGGIVVSGLSPVGPARAAGFRRGDVIVRLNGEKVESQEEFYRKLWQGGVEQEVQVIVQRERGFEAITVRPTDRYRFFRTPGN
jgi:S1-C subfamily serine protease